MKAEIALGSGDDELIVTLSTADLPDGDRITAAGLARTMPRFAGQFAEGILGLVGAPKEPVEPRRVRARTIRIAEVRVIHEITVMLDSEKEVFT